MYISSELSLEVAYYNETLAVWEPLIEPTEIHRGVFKPWEVVAEVTKSHYLKQEQNIEICTDFFVYDE